MSPEPIEHVPEGLLSDLRALKREAELADLRAQLAKARYERGCALAFLSMGLRAEDSINVDTGVVTRAFRATEGASSSE